MAQKQKLPGKAIRFTNKALALEPNDLDALAVQGEAMVELGAVAAGPGQSRQAADACAPSGCPQVAHAGERDQPRADGRRGDRPSRREPKNN